MNATSIARIVTTTITAAAATGMALAGTGLAQAGTAVKSGPMPMAECVATAAILTKQNNPDYTYGPGEDIPIYAGYTYSYMCMPAATIGDAFLFETMLG